MWMKKKFVYQAGNNKKVQFYGSHGDECECSVKWLCVLISKC
jgi:hypothetical protein